MSSAIRLRGPLTEVCMKTELERLIAGNSVRDVLSVMFTCGMYDFAGEFAKSAEQAHEKLKAKSVTPGQYDLVLDPTNLWLTIHESVGHPTELDRALGWEANFAGTTFCTPDKLGKLQYGSPLVTIVADATTASGNGTFGWDDEGVPAARHALVQHGLFVDYLSSRETAAASLLAKAS